MNFGDVFFEDFPGGNTESLFLPLSFPGGLTTATDQEIREGDAMRPNEGGEAVV
jgi:hypothetical protein